MGVLEEPFMTRDAILAVLRPGQAVTESPFRTLRQRHCASEGIRVEVRTVFGQLLGRTHLYSSLNADAARAFRRQELGLAQQIAARAAELERSRPAATIRDAIRSVAAAMTTDPLSAGAPIALQRYLRLRARTSWRGLDTQALTREWLVQSEAWLSGDGRDELLAAVRELAQSAHEARADLISGSYPPVSTFLGVIRRMDAVAAEIEGSDGALLVPRADLERQGLAVVGQAVALLCEALPAGGSLVIPMPAVAADVTTSLPTAPDPWDVEGLDGAGTPATLMKARDFAWLERELAREPTAVPAAPIQRA